MKAHSLIVFIFVISALTSPLHAGQDNEKEGQGTGAEPECDYAPVSGSLMRYQNRF